MIRKVTVNITGEAFETLEAVAEAEGSSRTDVINRAIIAYAALSAAPLGRRVTLSRTDGSVWREFFASGLE